MNTSIFYIFITFLLNSSLIFSFFENVEFKKIPTPCDYVCEGGGCLFTNCENRAYCPGGACDFISSVSPSCSGGFFFFVFNFLKISIKPLKKHIFQKFTNRSM